MDFVTALPMLTDKKGDSYNLILVNIYDWLIKIVYYKLVKISINATGLAKVIINVIIYHYGLPDLIITGKSLLFTLKFWLLLYYFVCIKH